MWYEFNLYDILKEYPKRFHAIRNKKIIGSSESKHDLISQLSSKYKLGEYAVADSDYWDGNEFFALCPPYSAEDSPFKGFKF